MPVHIMKTIISVLVTYLVLGFLGILSAEVSANDKRMNELIEKYTPVYDASSISATSISEEDTLYDPDSYSNTSVVAHIGVRLENAVDQTPKATSSLMKTFMGYSDKNSYLQLYIRPMSLSSYVWGKADNLFGEKIPLVPGSYVIEGKDEGLGKMRVTVKVILSKLNIKVSSSGQFYNSYEDAPIYEVQITKVERL